MTAQAPASAPAWHTLPVDEALKAQGVDPASGPERRRGREATRAVRAEQVRRGQEGVRLEQVRAPVPGPDADRAAHRGRRSAWSSSVSAATALLLFGLTLLNAVMSLNQEGKAEASVAALQKMMIVQSRVRRDGELVQIPAHELVPGDIVAVEAGDRIPADARIIKAATLEIDESALTGESAPVPKEVDAGPQRRHAARRPGGHGLHEHQRHARVGRAGGDRHRHEHRGRAHLRACCRRPRTRRRRSPGSSTRSPTRSSSSPAWRWSASIALGYFIYDQPFEIAVHLGGRLLRGGRADRPAGRGHHPAVDRDEDAGRRPAPS